MSVLHALLPVQHVPAVRECASSMAARMPSGMDDEVQAEANVSQKGERTSSEKGVAGSSKMTSSTPLQLQCACVVELCQLFLPTFSHSPSFTASPHPLHFWDYHGRTETQATAPIRPLLRPTTISRFSPPTTPSSVVSSANHTVYTRSYSLPPQCRCPYNRQRLLLLHFSPPFIVSSHYRSPTYRSQALPLRTMSSSTNNNKLTLHRSSWLPFQQTQPTASAAAELAGLISLVGIDPFASCLFSFLFCQGR
jgi:hypothetical protein